MDVLYMYSPDTGEYIGTRPVQIVGGKPLVKSAFATQDAPPTATSGQVARWTGTAWELVEDHRQQTDEQGMLYGGTPYWLPVSGDTWQSPPRYMQELGPLPEGATTTQPAKPAPTQEELFAALRIQRDSRLTATDYLLMPDYPIDDTTRAAVQTYRQALRDLPSQSGAPWDGGGEATPWPMLPDVLKAANEDVPAASAYLPPRA